MPWSIPLTRIDLGSEEIEALGEVIASKWLTMGSVTQEFEARFASAIGVAHAFLVNNCTAALHLAMEAVGVGSGDEVICPALTFVASSNAILYAGGTPVFAEVASEADLTLSPEDLERRITPRTKAILVVHYAGYACDMDAIMAIARRHGVAVIEDCAHSPLGTYRGRFLGTIGNVGCFSFFSNKNMTTGEGGMLVTNSPDVAAKVKLMRSHGMTTLSFERHKGHASSYDVLSLGYNYRSDELHAALGLAQLSKLDANNGSRSEVARYYRRHLAEVPGVVVPFEGKDEGSVHHLLPILVPEGSREAIMAHLKAARIQTSIHYPPVHLFTYYRERFGFQTGDLPLTESIAQRELTLPMYPRMTEEEVLTVVAALRRALEAIAAHA